VTGDEHAAAAIDTEPESIAEYNAFMAMINEINLQERRARALPEPLMLVPALRTAVTPLRAMLIEPERAWSIAKNVRLPNGRTFGELVTIVAPEVDGTIPNRVTFFTALGRAVEEAQRMQTRPNNAGK
jgi:hypothetical protein